MMAKAIVLRSGISSRCLDEGDWYPLVEDLNRVVANSPGFCYSFPGFFDRCLESIDGGLKGIRGEGG